jgi:hypothetical protein
MKKDKNIEEQLQVMSYDYLNVPLLMLRDTHLEFRIWYLPFDNPQNRQPEKNLNLWLSQAKILRVELKT